MTERRPPYAAAAAAAAALFIVYAATLAPTTAWWDASEYIATAHTLGIPHPPGNPLFVLVGRTWEVLLSPLGLSPAVRVNLLAAVTSAGAAFFWYLVAHRVLAGFVRDRRAALIGAAAAVLIGGTAYTVWSQSNVNEKVYTVSMLFIAAASWCAVRWHDRRGTPVGVRYLLAVVFLLVLGSTNHLMSLLPVPALGLYIVLVEPRALLRRDFLVRAVPLALLCLSVNFYLPIRAAEDPAINEGDPTCGSVVGAAVSVYTWGRAGCPALSASLSREQYQKPSVSDRQAPLGHQFRNWFQWFDWQWARGAAADPVPGNSRIGSTFLFLALGLFGFWTAWKGDRPTAVYLGALAGTLTVGLVFYLNFKYGYSLAPEIRDPTLHEVRERDYFFIVGFQLWGVMAGIGLAGAWDLVAGRLDGERARLLTAPVLLVAFIPLVMNAAWADRSGDYAARDWAYDLLMSVEPYGVLFTSGDNDTFPLWYLQEVEGIRTDVTVVVGSYLYTDWYPKQLRRMTRPANQRRFDPGGPGGEVYRAPESVPDSPILEMTGEEMDRVWSQRIREPTTIALGPVTHTLPSGTYLGRPHLMTLLILRDTLGERPVYFASSGGIMREVGLDRRGVREGLVSRVSVDDPGADEGEVRLPGQLGGGWVDYPRTEELTRDVYRYRSLRDREIWPDRSTSNIAYHYYILFMRAGAAARVRGEAEAASAYFSEARAFLVTARGGSRGGGRLPDTAPTD